MFRRSDGWRLVHALRASSGRSVRATLCSRFSAVEQAGTDASGMPNGEEAPTMEEPRNHSAPHPAGRDWAGGGQAETCAAARRAQPKRRAQGTERKARSRSAVRPHSFGLGSRGRHTRGAAALAAKILRKPNRMPDQPARPVFGKAENVLGESEEEDCLEEIEVEQGAGASATSPMETVVLQLTKIVNKMAKAPGRDFEGLLDGADCRPTDAAVGSTGGKS